ncbi:caspase family protein [Chitinophaga deserti]|uniref:caspase family protein n=1 Tax=Chitinophaga deserti TaxID=2164099 RepID=UPI000D6AB9B8|nr:caspase family protein [Chitinophaga deserti]
MPELFNKAFPASKAFLIGVENYTGGLSPLQTPFNDIDDLKSVLESAHGFLCPEVVDEDTGRVMPNPLKDPTANDIRTYLQNIRCGPNDRVLVYFACHGIAEEWDERPKGFILAADAGMKKGAGYVSMDEIMSGLEHLSCRHLLLVLDCCFAGAIRWASNTRGISGMVPKSISVELFSQFSQSCARQILTSSTFEESLDTIGTRENKGRNSPFAGILIDALETGAADLRFGQDQCDGLISVSELHLYIRDRIFRMQHAGRRKLENRQIPLLLPFGKHDKGEFVFLNPKVPLGLHRRSEFNPYKGTAEYGFADSAVFYGREVMLRAIRGSGFDIPEKGGGITVIYGPARCGKTSLAKAGLLARYWRKDTSLTKVHTIGAGSSLHEGFREVLKEVYESRETQYLLIDPFDEWLSDSIGAQESRMMTEAVSKLSDMHQIILILRPMQERKLRKLLASGAEMYRGWKDKISWFEVTPPSADEIMGIIERPAVQQMLPFASDEADDQGGENFINRLVQDLLDEPGAISLLSQTMYRLYKDRAMSHDSLSESSYDNFGTVTGVLAGQAESIYALYAQDEADRKAFQLLCFRMVQFSGGKIISNKVNVSGWLREGPDELQYTDAATSLRIWRISQELLRAGVITEELKGDEYFLLPAHGRFFPKWERMQGWLSEKQDGQEVKSVVRLHHNLAEAAAGWESMPAAKQNQLLGTWAARHDLWEMEAQLKPMLNKQELAFFNKIADRRKQMLRNRKVRYAVAGLAILALSIVGLFGSYKSYQAALKVFTEKIRAESVLHPPAVTARMLEWASGVFPSAETDSMLEAAWNDGVKELYLSHRILSMEEKVDSVYVLANGYLVTYENGFAEILNREGSVIRRILSKGWTVPSFSGKYFIRGNSYQTSVYSESGQMLATMMEEENFFTTDFNGAADDVIFKEKISQEALKLTYRIRVWRPGKGVIFDMVTHEMLQAENDNEALIEQVKYVPEKNELLIAGFDLVLNDSMYFDRLSPGQFLFSEDGHRRRIHNELRVFYNPAFIKWGKDTDSLGLVGKFSWPEKDRRVLWYNSNKPPRVSGNCSTAYIIDPDGNCYWRSVKPGDTAVWKFSLFNGIARADAISEDGQTLYLVQNYTLYVADFRSREVKRFIIPGSLRPEDGRDPKLLLQPSRSGKYLMLSNKDGRQVLSLESEVFKEMPPNLLKPVFANVEGDTLAALSPDQRFIHFISDFSIDRNLNSFIWKGNKTLPEIRAVGDALFVYSDSIPTAGFSLADHHWLDASGINEVFGNDVYRKDTRKDSTLVFQHLAGGNWKVNFEENVRQVYYSPQHQQAIVELTYNKMIYLDVKTRKKVLLPLNFYGFRACQFLDDRVLIAHDSCMYTFDRATHALAIKQMFPYSPSVYYAEKSGSGYYLFEENGALQYGNLADGFKWQADLNGLHVDMVTFVDDEIVVTGSRWNYGSDSWYILDRKDGAIRWQRDMYGTLGEMVYDKPHGQIFYLDYHELKVYSFPDRIRELLRKPILPPLPESISRKWTPKRLESWWNYVFSLNE